MKKTIGTVSIILLCSIFAAIIIGGLILTNVWKTAEINQCKYGTSDVLMIQNCKDTMNDMFERKPTNIELLECVQHKQFMATGFRAIKGVCND